MLRIKHNKQKYLFVDLENIHNLNVDKLKHDNVKIYMLVGSLQNRLPFDLVNKMQQFGSNVSWIKILSEGKNNLDFHLCYLLGEYNKITDTDIPFFVLSKDKGYDGVIKYINYQGRKCKRIEKI